MSKRKMNKRKKIIIILCVVLLMCIPLPFGTREGELASYRAILFSYTSYRVIRQDDNYYTTSEFLFFSFNLFG